jgi:hypothetical protein
MEEGVGNAVLCDPQSARNRSAGVGPGLRRGDENDGAIVPITKHATPVCPTPYDILLSMLFDCFAPQ